MLFRRRSSSANLQFYHRKCYQKYTKAISVLKTKKGVTDTPCQPSSSRVKRTGDLGKTLFLDYCMICRKSRPIYVKKKKQFPRLLELEKAEKSIEDAADIRQDDIMLAAIRSVYSLRAAEFRVHEKCQKDYTRVCPTKTKRSKVDVMCSEMETGEVEKDSTDTIEEMEVDTQYNQGDREKLVLSVQENILGRRLP